MVFLTIYRVYSRITDAKGGKILSASKMLKELFNDFLIYSYRQRTRHLLHPVPDVYIKLAVKVYENNLNRLAFHPIC